MITIKEIPIRTTISGLTHKISVIDYQVKDAEFTVFLQAGIHAAEMQGIAIINELHYFLKHNTLPFNIKMIPFANPFAMDIKIGEYTFGRFDAKTGDNWNRSFKNLLEPIAHLEALDVDAQVKQYQQLSFKQACIKFEKTLQQRLALHANQTLAPHQHLAAILHKEAISADFSFDLHNDSISCSYIYAPSYLNNKRLKHFNSDYFIFTPNEPSACFNQAIFYPWWQFTDAWNALTGESHTPPKHAFTYETGNKESFCLNSAKHLLKGILDYITHKKTPTNERTRYGCYEHDYFRLRSPQGGLVDYDDQRLGKPSQANQSLADIHTLDSILGKKQTQSITCSQQNILLTRVSSASVHQGDEVFKVMVNYFKL